MLLISPQLVEHNKAIAEEKKLAVDILSDPGNQVAAQFGLRYVLPEDLRALYEQFGLDLPGHNGDASWSLPLPARYVIDAEGIIRHAAVNADYTRRPDPEETLAIIRQLD